MIDITFSSRKSLPLKAGFSLRSDFGPHGGECCWLPDTLELRRDQFARMCTGSDRVASIQQVHGNDCVYVDQPGEHDSADALWTDQPGLAISIKVADCIPLLCYLNHHDKPAIGAIHVGWRGAQSNIVQKTIDQRSEAGYDPARMYMWMGPSICQTNYEFGEEAVEIFGEDYCSISMGSTYLDLRSYVMDQLRAAGIISSHIRYHGSCTVDDEKFFSHRQDPTTGQRMFGVIMLEE